MKDFVDCPDVPINFVGTVLRSNLVSVFVQNRLFTFYLAVIKRFTCNKHVFTCDEESMTASTKSTRDGSKCQID